MCRKHQASCSAAGPSTLCASMVRMRTFFACTRSGIANAVARADSMLWFQAMTIVSPRLFGGSGGASSTGTSALEKRRLGSGHARISPLCARTAKDGHVEHAGVTGDLVIAERPVAGKAIGKAVAAFDMGGNGVLDHEGLEAVMRFVRRFLQCIQVSRRPAHRHVEPDEIGQVGTEKHPFDIAVKTSAEQERGLQHGLDRRMHLDRHENVFHGLFLSLPEVRPEERRKVAGEVTRKDARIQWLLIGLGRMQ